MNDNNNTDLSTSSTLTATISYLALPSTSIAIAVPDSPVYYNDHQAEEDAEEARREAEKSRRMSVILGIALGLPLGLSAIAFISYIVHRHIKRKATNTISNVHFPPDPINPFASRIIAKAELDTQPNAIAELYAHNAPSEIEGSSSHIADLSELEGCPGEISNRDPAR
jgi:hypothetical protein